MYHEETQLILPKDYEAEAWEGSHHSDETGYDTKSHSRMLPPRSHGDASPRSYQPASQSGDHYRDTNLTMNNSANPNLRLGSQGPSHHSLNSFGGPQMSQFAPQLPFMPFPPGAGSVHGSEFGAPLLPPMPHSGSLFGMAGPPRNTVMSGMFGAQSLRGPPSLADPRPYSTFSAVALTSSNNTDPSDDELHAALRTYLSTQDLMTVTKK